MAPPPLIAAIFIFSPEEIFENQSDIYSGDFTQL